MIPLSPGVAHAGAFLLIKVDAGLVINGHQFNLMPTFTFLYRCPNTGLDVQGWTAEDLAEGDGDHLSYEQVKCAACHQVHFVNPKTGRGLAAGEE